MYPGPFPPGHGPPQAVPPTDPLADRRLRACTEAAHLSQDSANHSCNSTAGPAYLFVGAVEVASPATVFYLAGNAERAETICRLLTRANSEVARRRFCFRVSSAFTEDDCLLLDEAVESLSMYDDPDPGVYDPSPSPSVMARANYMWQAKGWEERLSVKAKTVARSAQSIPAGIDTYVIIADAKVHFGDSHRVIPSHGAVVAAVASRALADGVVDMYRLERGDDALPLILVQRSSLTVTQVALANRELARSDGIGSNLGCEVNGTRDATFASIGRCAMELARLTDELRPVVASHPPTSSAIPPKDSKIGFIVEEVDALLRAVERHRLTFLYWSAASRRNPLACGSRTGTHERVLRDGVRGWKTMCDAIDSEGEFLWTHRDVLDRYAEEAIGAFGPGDGMTATATDRSGNPVAVAGATPPYWSLDDGSTSYLEQTSDAILEACRPLASHQGQEPLSSLLTDAIAAARPSSHSRWYTCVVVNWSYLTVLDDLITRIKVVRVRIAAKSTSTGKQARSAKAAERQDIADLAMVLMITRDVHRIGSEYPEAIPENERTAWLDDLTRSTDVLAALPGLESIATAMKSAEVQALEPSTRCACLLTFTLLLHPSAQPSDGTAATMKTCIEQTLLLCQESASTGIKSQMERLSNVMIVACRSPSGKGNTDFENPSRYLQMLQHYWGLANALIQARANCEADFVPHPLLHLIENIRDRMGTCFEKLGDVAGTREAKEVADRLLTLLTEGEVDDLGVVPEWTFGEISKVETLLARTRLALGAREFELTEAERYFIKMSEQLTAEHKARSREAWKQMVARVDANTAANAKKAATSPTQAAYDGRRPSTSNYIPAADLAQLANKSVDAIELWGKEGEVQSGNRGAYRKKVGKSRWLYNWPRWNEEHPTDTINPLPRMAPSGAPKAVKSVRGAASRSRTRGAAE
mgnify:CR=1 FL=1